MVPTIYLLIGLIACAVTALTCWREAERQHHAVVPGLISVLAGVCFALLAAILIYRGAR
jgi:cation transporter-like permease